MIQLFKNVKHEWKVLSFYMFGFYLLFFVLSPVSVSAFSVSPSRGLDLSQGIVSDMVSGEFVCIVSPDGTQGRQVDYAYSTASTASISDIFLSTAGGGDWLGNNPHEISDTLQNGYWRVFSCINSFEADGLFSQSFYVNSSLFTFAQTVGMVSSTTASIGSALTGSFALILVLFAVLVGLNIALSYVKKYIGTSGVSGVGGGESVNSFGITASEQADIEREVRSRLN